MASFTPVARSWARASRAIQPGTFPRVALVRCLAAALAALALVFVCGCGSASNGVASKSPAEILAAATMAAQQASSVQVHARSANGPLVLTLDMSYARNGAHGTVSLLGLDYQLIRVADTLYVSGNSDFYRELARTLDARASAAVAELPAGTWLKAAVGHGPLSGLSAITEMSSELALILGRGTPVAKGAETAINRQRAIELKQTAKLYTGSLFIAATGKPYPIAERKRGRETGQTTFTGWDRPVTLTPPAAATDISQLEHGA